MVRAFGAHCQIQTSFSTTFARQALYVPCAGEHRHGWPSPCHAASGNSSCAPAQAKPAQPKNAVQVGVQHLDAFAVSARLLESLGLAERTSDVAGILMDAARDLARRLLWTDGFA